MTGSLNKVILIGNLGRDPEIRELSTGGKVAQFTLATSENWKDNVTGGRQEKTEWHTVVIFNERLVSVAERFLKKGTKVYLEGQVTYRKWTDKTGQERYTTEILISKYRGELLILSSTAAAAPYAPAPYSDFHGSPSAFPSTPESASKHASSTPSFPSSIEDEDDIPF